MKHNKNNTSTTTDNRKSSQLSHPSHNNNNNNNHHQHQHHHHNNSHNNNNNRRANGMSNNGSIHKNNHHTPSIWTTNTSRSSSKSNFTSGSNDFHFIQASDINTTKGSDIQNGSTAKLLPYGDDQSNTQVSSNHDHFYSNAHRDDSTAKVSQNLFIILLFSCVCYTIYTQHAILYRAVRYHFYGRQ